MSSSLGKKKKKKLKAIEKGKGMCVLSTEKRGNNTIGDQGKRSSKKKGGEERNYSQREKRRGRAPFKRRGRKKGVGKNP